MPNSSMGYSVTFLFHRHSWFGKESVSFATQWKWHYKGGNRKILIFDRIPLNNKVSKRSLIGVCFTVNVSSICPV